MDLFRCLVPSNWTVSVSFIYSKAILLQHINCNVQDFVNIWRFSHFLHLATSLALLKLHNFYIMLLLITDTVGNGPYF